MNQSTLRLTRELADIQKSNDLSIAVACRDSDIRNIRALILGPPETPYEFGFFEFTMKFPKEYPGKAPAVNAITTNGGRCRFNPNIYAGGKVCLSILGQHDKDNQKAYVLKIRHETLRIAIIQRLEEYLGLKADGTSIVREPRDEAGGDSSSAYVDEGGVYFFEPFKDLCKRRFLWYYDTYLASIQAEKEKVTEGQAFVQMPFEMSGGSGGNSMEGKFNYPELERRIQNIRQKLDVEAEGWGVEGMKAFKDERGVAANLQRQFEQAKVFFDKSETATLDMELEDNNPFIWRVTYFGRPMTNLDGGLFIFTVRFSVRFPDEQPRVQFSTPMFHHKINKDGIPAYFPGGLHPRPDDAKSHIEGVISLLEEEDPAYDPRTQINIDASKLYWGTKEEKREYSKQFRRSVQRSIEYA
ncbi:hypothetical protein TWF191_006525 [Orbilia oligospora]|uniref:UBC core domain-containing protein n=1 Tax=Orbilia oligospora TaxID=2813651 RepID=A0A7C8QSC0_ORBOL|nr:hypothetical protein TWF191_006525 [Orbilia oligospora]